MKEQIILTGSCYWCLEAIFKKVKGVINVESGMYHIDDYQFSFGKDDKLEAIRVTYESNILSLSTLFDFFYLTHNPTIIKWDKKDCFYPMCRSSIICFTTEQKKAAEDKIQTMTEGKEFDDEIQTKVAQVIDDNFFLAPEKYRDYYTKNPKDGYCLSIIVPKLDKMKLLFKEHIKTY